MQDRGIQEASPARSHRWRGCWSVLAVWGSPSRNIISFLSVWVLIIALILLPYDRIRDEEQAQLGNREGSFIAYVRIRGENICYTLKHKRFGSIFTLGEFLALKSVFKFYGGCVFAILCVISPSTLSSQALNSISESISNNVSSIASEAFENSPRSGMARTAGAIPAATPGAFSAIGLGAHIGINGIGFDVATPLSRHINLRAGADFFSYSDNFIEQQANVSASLQLRSGHANLDWFPFANGFHVSPMINFANNNGVRATVIVPPGTSITLSGGDYVSSLTDPLHGNGSVDFRKVSPGLTVGYGNIIPRSRKHFSYLVELGFYYVGQPRLNVTFTGSACDPTQPAAIGCQSVDQDQDFQESLAAFKSRNNNNLSYASFFPVLSTGVGYRF